MKMCNPLKWCSAWTVVIVVVLLEKISESKITVRNVEGIIEPMTVRLTSSSPGNYSSLLHERMKRDSPASPSSSSSQTSSSADNDRLLVNFTILPDEGHNEAIVHWSGKDSQAIFLLTRQRTANDSVVSSTLYISLDYGSSFKKKTFDPSVVLHYFYICPNNKDKLVFVDLKSKNLHVTTDEGKTFQTKRMIKDADRIVFHPTEDDWILSYSEKDRTLHLSRDLGTNWILVHELVNPRFYWAVLEASVDKDQNTIHLEVEDPATGQFLYRAVTDPYPKQVVVDKHLGFIEVGSVVVQNEYIFVQKKTPFSSHLYVSHMRRPFRRTYFPRDTHPTDFEIVDTDDHQVFIAASHQAGAVTLYLSDATGRLYVKSLNNVVAVSQAENFKVDLYEVRGLPGTYLANRLGTTSPETLITFNQGGKWQRIPAPEKDENGTSTDCHLPDCGLYVHLHIDSYFYGIPRPLTDQNAPGLVLAQGVIGKEKRRQTKFIMSQDGGLTWTVVMNGTYRKSILDQGGAIVAVPVNPVTLDATEVMYSCTEGKTWGKFTFSGQHMKVDGLLNEPGITTLIASLYGHTTATKDEAKAGWMIAKLNFSLILSSSCRPADYQCWFPYSGVVDQKCLMGQRSCYERRLADVECFNGEDYERAINVTSCNCTSEDYECDFGYELKDDKCAIASWFDPSVPVEDCEVGTTFLNSSGYRKVASSRCTGEIFHAPVNTTCPFIRPKGLQIQVDGSEFQPRKANVTFLVYQERGTRVRTNYTLNFGDASPALKATGIHSVERVTHAFQKTGICAVTVEAVNSMGTASASVLVSIQEDMVGLHLAASRAVQVGKRVTFQAVPLFRDQTLPLSNYNIHYLWLFGNEGSNKNGELSWNSSAAYTYAVAGNYTVWVQAFTAVGSVYRTMTVPVYGTVTTVQLTLSGISLPLGSASTAFEDMVADALRRVVAFEVNVSLNRVDVEFSQQMALVVFVSFLPPQQTMTEDDSIAQVLQVLFDKVKERKIVFTLPDEAFGSRNNITVVSASVVSGGDDGGGSIASGRMLGLAIGIPVLLLALLVSILVTIYYKRRLSSLHSYSILHSRYRPGENLLDDTDDDDPLIDSSSSIAGRTGGGGGTNSQRLIMSDDDDLLGTQILLSDTVNATNRAGLDDASSGRAPVAC